MAFIIIAVVQIAFVAFSKSLACGKRSDGDELY